MTTQTPEETRQPPLPITRSVWGAIRLPVIGELATTVVAMSCAELALVDAITRCAWLNGYSLDEPMLASAAVTATVGAVCLVGRELTRAKISKVWNQVQANVSALDKKRFNVNMFMARYHTRLTGLLALPCGATAVRAANPIMPGMNTSVSVAFIAASLCILPAAAIMLSLGNLKYLKDDFSKYSVPRPGG